MGCKRSDGKDRYHWARGSYLINIIVKKIIKGKINPPEYIHLRSTESKLVYSTKNPGRRKTLKPKKKKKKAVLNASGK